MQKLPQAVLTSPLEEKDLDRNHFGIVFNPTKEDLEECKAKIKNDKPSEKYRATLPYKGFKFPYEDYIDFKVNSYKNDGTTIKIKTYCYYSTGSNPIAVVYLLHGFGNHSNKNAHLAKYLADRNIAVFSMDHREHGLSQYDIGYVKDFNDFVNDAIDFVTKTREFYKAKFKIDSLPEFIMGSSMGGLITNYVTKKLNFTGVIYDAPYFGLDRGRITKSFLSLIGYMMPSFYVGNIIGLNLNSKNPNFIDDACPISKERFPRFGTVKVVCLQSDEFAKEKNITHERSMLIIAPGVEKNVDFDSTINYYLSSQVRDKSIWLYPNMWHATLVEEEVYDIMPRLFRWIKERIKG